MLPQFQKAVKYQARGRIALIGPAGSGKSLTALKFARELAGPEGKIAAVDTEHGSLSKYAPKPGEAADNEYKFDFDVVEPDTFAADDLIEFEEAAAKAGYVVLLCDSLSHYWVGKDGAFDFVDAAKKRSNSRDGMAGWLAFRPHERAMVDCFIGSSMHVIVTMRTKTAYEEQTVNGKKQRVKIGLAPVQRDGLEYEFDLVGAMDDENTLIVDKSRCPELARKSFSLPGAKVAKVFKDWLAGEEAPAPPPPAARPAKQDLGGTPAGARQTEYTYRVPGAGSSPGAEPPLPEGPPPEPEGSHYVVQEGDTQRPRNKPFDFKEMIGEFGKIKTEFLGYGLVGKNRYYDVLAAHGVKHANEFKTAKQARKCYAALKVALAELNKVRGRPQLVKKEVA